MMTENYCAFSRNHKCLKYEDYEFTKYTLAEADELCHGNWIEIQRKEEYIRTLQSLLSENGIFYPDEPY